MKIKSFSKIFNTMLKKTTATNVITRRVEDLVSRNKLADAFKVLLETVTSDSNFFEVITSEYLRFRTLESHKNNGTLSPEFINLEMTELSVTLHKIIDQLTEDDYKKNINVVVTLEKPILEPSPKFNFWSWFRHIFSPSY
jgi:Effector-associated domain 11